jgi:hypothetical protein
MERTNSWVVIGECYSPEPRVIAIAGLYKNKLLNRSNPLITAPIMNRVCLNINCSDTLHLADCKSDPTNLNLFKSGLTKKSDFLLGSHVVELFTSILD